MGDDFTHRLVVRQHASRRRRDAVPHRLAIDVDAVAKRNSLPRVRHFGIHGDAAFGNHLFQVAARTDAGLRQHLVQLGCVGLRGQHPLGGIRSIGSGNFFRVENIEPLGAWRCFRRRHFDVEFARQHLGKKFAGLWRDDSSGGFGRSALLQRGAVFKADFFAATAAATAVAVSAAARGGVVFNGRSRFCAGDVFGSGFGNGFGRGFCSGFSSAHSSRCGVGACADFCVRNRRNPSSSLWLFKHRLLGRDLRGRRCEDRFPRRRQVDRRRWCRCLAFSCRSNLARWAAALGFGISRRSLGSGLIGRVRLQGLKGQQRIDFRSVHAGASGSG